MRTHYEILGITRAATPAQVKTAYRKVVLQHHPDKSKAPESKAIFLAAQEAYKVLSDPMHRKSYDATLDLMAPPKEPKPKPPTPKPPAAKPAEPKPRPKPPEEVVKPKPTIPQRLQQLQNAFAQGRVADAERMANEILQDSPREAIPYAVLGDMARARGDLNEAARLYAFAAQFAPTNPAYQKRYEELLDRSRMDVTRGNVSLQASTAKISAPLVGAGVVFSAGSYLVFSNEAPMMGGARPLTTWTLGLVVMLFVSGIAVGTSMAMGNLLDRFQSTIVSAGGRTGPNLAIGIVSVFSFWLACGLYVVLGLRQKAFTVTTTRLFFGVGIAVAVLSMATGLSHNVSGWETLLWGGNVTSVGALCGWMISDAFRSD